MADELQRLREKTAKARKAADDAVAAATAAQEKADELTRAAVDLETELDSAEWRALQEAAGASVLEDGRTVRLADGTVPEPVHNVDGG